MLKRILIIALIFAPLPCLAQQVVQPCVNVTTNGTTTCVPISATNPLPTTSN